MISAASISRGWPATGVWELGANRSVERKSPAEIAGDEVILAAAENPPRTCETRAIGTLIPDVLARYGLDRPVASARTVDEALEGIDLRV